jgi:unsaturated chondroitin disaccharide hydrolase
MRKSSLLAVICLLPVFSSVGLSYDLLDFADFSTHWFQTGCSEPNWCGGSDLDMNGEVNFADLGILCEDWLFAADEAVVANAVDFAERQLANTAKSIGSNQYPYSTIDSYANWWLRPSWVWTSGFFPGCMWRIYELNGEPNYLDWAEEWTAGLEDEAYSNYTQDLVFMIHDTFGTGYRLTGNPYYKEVVLAAAQTVSTLCDPVVGLINANWGPWEYPVNIDSTMAVELLFWASKNGGEAAWYDMAVRHCYRIIENFVRPDGSTYHFANFDPNTGELIEYLEGGGYSTDTTWSRGQAWGLYGFTVAYRETEDPNFLETAVKIADYYVNNLPADYVPYWDFEAPEIPDAERDTSAAAIATSALFELSVLTDDLVRKKEYKMAAEKGLMYLCERKSRGGYLAEDENGNSLSKGILMDGCQNHNNICDESLIWGDYYFIEAILRYKSIQAP